MKLKLAMMPMTNAS